LLFYLPGRSFSIPHRKKRPPANRLLPKRARAFILARKQTAYRNIYSSGMAKKKNIIAETAPLPRVSLRRRAWLTARRIVATRVFLVAASISAFALACAGLYRDESVRAAAYAHYAAASESLGLTVRHFYLEGLRHTRREDALAIIAPYQGMPIFSVPIADIKREAEKLPWVDVALVERLLPSTTAIRLREHVATALWQYEGAFYLIDAYGEKITEVNDYAEYGDLILVSGFGAAEKLPELMEQLRAYPQVAARVASASFIGERRWDVYLKNGVLLRLPEVDPRAAMKQVQAMLESGLLEGGRVQTVDLKEGRRIYLLPPDAEGEEAEKQG